MSRNQLLGISLGILLGFVKRNTALGHTIIELFLPLLFFHQLQINYDTNRCENSTIARQMTPYILQRYQSSQITPTFTVSTPYMDQSSSIRQISGTMFAPPITPTLPRRMVWGALALLISG